MFIGGGLAMMIMATFGGMLVNYGWREAQNQEIESALKAGVAASAHFMRGNIADAEEQIKERVAAVMRGLLDDATLDADDIFITHENGRIIITIGGDATFAFRTLWAGGGAGEPESITGERVIVEFDASQFEFALALDVSRSMGIRPVGWTSTRLHTLKQSIRFISETVDELSEPTPGLAALALVPFASAVNIADTSGPIRTAAKERYVRMLAGADFDTQTARDTEEHWVDMFHSYGYGKDMGALHSRSFPDFTQPSDWNLHAPGAEDVTEQAPHLGTWTFEGGDFWNGCVVARWGAYWNPDARPVIWNPTNRSNYPATKNVGGWTDDALSIHSVPLHLSDAPPDASDPNTRFVAYSYPDSRVAGLADSAMSHVMRKTLDPSFAPDGYLSHGENHWNLREDRGGSLFCPEATIVPLTDDLDALAAADTYGVVEHHTASYRAQTFLHLGIVWGLRALSPLWTHVWKTKNSTGEELPRQPTSYVEKAIVIVSDGANFFGEAGRGRTFGATTSGKVNRNPSFDNGQCWRDVAIDPAFAAAMAAEDAAVFAQSFDVDSNGALSADGLEAALDGFQAVHPSLSALDPRIPAHAGVIDAHRAIWTDAMKDMSPWELFRGSAADALANPVFGLRGRPVMYGHHCRPHTPFSAYGRVEDLLNVGEDPVEGASPFSAASWSPASPVEELKAPLQDRLDEWLMAACNLAGTRGVRIHAIYIGDDKQPWEQRDIAVLERCVDRGYDGNPLVEEVHIAPTQRQLQDAMEDVIDIRRTLRFVQH